MDCEIREHASLQESNYQVFKNICTNGEVTLEDKCSLENCELDHSIISFLLNSVGDKSSCLMTEVPNTVSSLSKGSESYHKDNCVKDVMMQCDSENLFSEVKGGLGASVEIGAIACPKDVVLEDEKPPLARESVNGYSCSQVSHSTGHMVQKEENQVIPCKEASFPISPVSSSTSKTRDATCKCNVETKSNTHGCDSSKITTIDQKRSIENADSQQPIRAENSSRLKDGISKSSRVQVRNSYSGSISFSSDSSKNSAHSFAFPVLASEWYDSPIRMVEADQEHSPKHRYWGMSFLCCKF